MSATRRSAGASRRRRAPALATCRSTAVFRPLKLKSVATSGGGNSRAGARRVPIGVRHPRHRKIDGAIVALLREPIDHRSAGIAEPEQLGHLVVRLPRRIVSRAAEQRRRPGSGTRYRLVCPPETTSTAAGSGSSPCEQERLDVAGEMMNRDERYARGPRSDLANATPTSSEPTSPGPCVTATAPIVASRRASRAPLDDAADVADVLTRGQLGDDAAPLAVNRRLRRDDVRADRQGRAGSPSRRRRPRPSRRRRSRCRDVHGDGARPPRAAGASASREQARPEDAAFGDDAGDVAVRRDVERGLRIFAPSGVSRDGRGA